MGKQGGRPQRNGELSCAHLSALLYCVLVVGFSSSVDSFWFLPLELVILFWSASCALLIFTTAWPLFSS